MRISAQLKYIVLSVLLVVATVSFTRTTLDIVKSSKRLDDLNEEVGEMEKKKGELQAEIDFKKTDEYIEERARNALSLVKPGEEIFIVVGEKSDGGESGWGSEAVDGGGGSKVAGAKSGEETADEAESVKGALSKKESFRDSNLYLWYKLFF